MRSGRVRWPFDAISFVVTFQRIVSISNGLNLKCVGEGVAQLSHHSRVQQELSCGSVCIVLWLDLMDGFATPRAVVICVC